MNRLDLKNLKYLDREIKRLRQRVEELQKIAIENELYEIDDVLIREIFMRKFVDGCSWGQTARKVGGMNTRDSVRKLANRFMKRKGWN